MYCVLFDLGDPTFQPKWNQKDGPVDRSSYSGVYRIDNGYPLNPYGRTGVIGRGLLGRWGPNHAADALVTRWSRGLDGNIKTHSVSGRLVHHSLSLTPNAIKLL